MKLVHYFSLILLLSFAIACNNEPKSKENTPATNNIGKTGNATIDNITRKINNNPKDVSLYVSRAQAFYRMEGYDEAILDMNRAIKLDTTKYEYFLFLGGILMDYNRSKDAIRVVNSAVHRFPENAECLLKQAGIYHILKQHHQSTAALNSLLLLDPQNAKAFFLFGQNFKELKDTTRAIQSYQKAVDLDPDILDGWINLGNLWSPNGPSIARKYYETAISIDTANVYALNSYALFLGSQNKFQQSIDVYKKIGRIDPQFSDGFFNAGIMYLSIDSAKLANQQFNLAVKTSPTFAKAYYYRGYTYEKMDVLDLAKADYEQALKFDPNLQKAAIALEAF